MVEKDRNMIHVEQVRRQEEKVGGEGEVRTGELMVDKERSVIHVEQVSRQEKKVGGKGETRTDGREGKEYDTYITGE